MNHSLITEKQDLTYLNWTKIRNSSGTAGSFLKAYYEIDGKKIYYKLSNYDAFRGVIGHESANEIIVDRLLTLLGVDHLSYQLIHADVSIYGKTLETWVCASVDYKQRDENKVALDVYYQAEMKENESPMQFCMRQGWGEYIYQMLVVDFLILNRDRHGANIEVLRNSKKKELRLAPLFDHGLSLVFNCYSTEALKQVEPMEDKPIQCFVGSRSAKDNLRLIPTNRLPKLPQLKNSDQAVIFDGIEHVLSRKYIDTIWKMIWERRKYYEDFCNQRG